MRKILLTVFSLLFFISSSFSITIPLPAQKTTQHQIPQISFTENKGQVHDQDHKPRPDVLYGVMTGNMAVHIRRDGVSYQLHRIESYKEVREPKTKQKRTIGDRHRLYRIDLEWLGHNSDFTTTQDEPLPGFSNYYFEGCPEGALFVKSYSGVTLNNLYNGINLHYYEKNTELKHDYIVNAHTDYRQIKLRVRGAEVRIGKNGCLLLVTPLGIVQEGAPLVFQNNRQLKASWRVDNNVLSFEIKDYDPRYPVVIDPVTRLWGTYYGDAGDDQTYSCNTDPSGNVYISGLTMGAAGTVIATSGSHQSSFSGNSYNAFLAKFSSSGSRLWATYYGGSYAEEGFTSATDASGNVYLAGVSGSGNGTAIATSGSHQTSLNGLLDAFLVKFNSNGVRLWGTYYGGQGFDGAYSCATDAQGNVFLAGTTESTVNIASSGSHQTAFGGGTQDVFLVKFNSSGTRQWGTYYGGAGYEITYACATDASGNVYLSGMTDSNSGTVIASAGSHQSAYGGGLDDDFLVKFNANGVRQWATYYGGAGYESRAYCCTDPSGNVYLTGETDGSTGTTVATAGSHQSVVGGISDGFLAKFNANGVRLWGTYYGGTGLDMGNACCTDASGNVYLAGQTETTSGTIIATPGSHQVNFAGSYYDGFVAIFDPNGLRQAASYYGGSGNDICTAIAVDGSGGIYVSGKSGTSTGTAIATSNGHQSVFGGWQWDSFLAKFEACTATPLQPPPVSGANNICSGPGAHTYSITNVAGATSYTWSLPPGWSGAGNTNTITVTPGSSGLFSVTAGNACGTSPAQTFSVTVNITPTITAGSGSICSGQSFTITAHGAASYTYSGGQVVTPASSISYSVTGTGSTGCIASNTAIVNLMVHPNPTISVNSGAICQGGTFVITPAGAVTYTIQGGSSVVSPTAAATYTVAGTSAPGCASSNTVVSNVSVNPLPVIHVSTTNSMLCEGSNAVLTASGALTYTFNPGGVGANITISPGTTTTYTVAGTDANNCSSTSTFIQTVDACTSIKSEESNLYSAVFIFPNPSNGIFGLQLDSGYELHILNALGQIVYSSQLKSGSHQFNLETLAKGVYVVRLNNTGITRNLKMIKE